MKLATFAKPTNQPLHPSPRSGALEMDTFIARAGVSGAVLVLRLRK